MRISFGRSGSNESAASWFAVAATSSGLPALGDRVANMEADVQPVEGVDGADEQRDLDLLLVAEKRLQARIVGVRRAGLMNAGQGFGPAERRAFALAEQRRLAPTGKHDHALRGFAELERVVHVKIKALAATVDLRRPELDQLREGRVEALLNDIAVLDQGLDEIEAGAIGVQSGSHRGAPWLGCRFTVT